MWKSRLFIVIASIWSVGVSALSLSPVGSYEVEEKDFVYAIAEGVELMARSYRPNKEGPLPAAVEVHGGAWNLYDRTAGELYNRALASSGLYVLAIDFRQGPDYQHPLGSRDSASAVRYLRQNAADLEIDPDSIGLIGSSSGGHLALLAGLKPEAEAHQPIATEVPDTGAETLATTSAEVNYIVALWPVSDPLYRYRYAERVERERLREFHRAYFGDEEAMADASIQGLLRADEAVAELPSVLIVQPGEDGNIPREMTFDLLAALQEKDAFVEYLFYPGMPHAFGHRPSDATEHMVRAIRDFIDSELQEQAAGPQ